MRHAAGDRERYAHEAFRARCCMLRRNLLSDSTRGRWYGQPSKSKQFLACGGIARTERANLVAIDVKDAPGAIVWAEAWHHQLAPIAGVAGYVALPKISDIPDNQDLSRGKGLPTSSVDTNWGAGWSRSPGAEHHSLAVGFGRAIDIEPSPAHALGAERVPPKFSKCFHPHVARWQVGNRNCRQPQRGIVAVGRGVVRGHA